MNPSSKSAYYRLIKIEWSNEGIIYVYPEENDILNEEDMLRMIDIMPELSGNRPFKMLFVLNGTQLLLSQDARELYKTNLKAKENVIAHAAVFNSRPLEILFDLLTRIYHPPFPLKGFRTLPEAKKWLEQF